MGRLRRRAAVLAALAVALLAPAVAGAAPRNPFAVNRGVYLSNSDTGVCAVQSPVKYRHCAAILSLNAVYERGDKTPPVLRYSYAHYQDFFRTGLVTVRVRSNEAALLNPECTLHTREAVWGLEYANRHLHPGKWVNFTCEIRGAAMQAARTALVRGGHPRIGIRLIAYDRAGNKGVAPKLFIRP
jgi:hypothetical protein